jgi:putative tryptophan/tyrosine transport system substrate-binding protein
MNLASDNPEGQTRLAAFQQELQQLGWGVGENLRLDYRWAAGAPERYRTYAAELIALTPDVILAITSPAVAALQQASNSRDRAGTPPDSPPSSTASAASGSRC